MLEPEKQTSLSASGTVNEQAVQFNAGLVQREGAWNLENMNTRLADSDLQGDIRVDTGGERPEIVADFTSETLNVERLTAFAKAVTDAGRPPKKAAQEDRLTVSPLKFDLHGGTVTTEVFLDAADAPLNGTLDATFEQFDLAEILDPFTDLDSDELGVLSGNLDITLTQTDPTALDRDILFPYLGTLKIAESRFTYVNSSKDTDLTLAVRTLPASDRELPARITGEGRYRDEPFDLSFRGDPLLDLREPDDSYSLHLVMKAADTRAEISGKASCASAKETPCFS